MKAPGLDPKEISEAAGDDTHPKSKDRLLSENKQQTIKPKDSGISNKLVYNNDHSSQTVSEDDTDSYNFESDTDDTKVASLQAAKHLPEHLKQIKEAPMDQHKKRRGRQLLGKEDKTSDTPPLSHRSSYGQSPHKKGQSRGDVHEKVKEKQLLDRQVTDSQLLQATHDDPNGRKKREKPLAKIDR